MGQQGFSHFPEWVNGQVRSRDSWQHSIHISFHSNVDSSIFARQVYSLGSCSTRYPNLLLGYVPNDEFAISAGGRDLGDFPVTSPLISVDPSDTVLVNSQQQAISSNSGHASGGGSVASRRRSGYTPSISLLEQVEGVIVESTGSSGRSSTTGSGRGETLGGSVGRVVE